MSKITLQEIFNKAWQHFIVEENKPAVFRKDPRDTFTCCYLTEDGRKCAIGLALPDNHECQKVQASFDVVAQRFPELFDDQILRLNPYNAYWFQKRLHDDLVDPYTGNWKFNLEARKASYLEAAKEFSLTVPE